MIKFTFAFEQICFMQFAFDECKFFLASSHPYFRVNIIQRYHSFVVITEMFW